MTNRNRPARHATRSLAWVLGVIALLALPHGDARAQTGGLNLSWDDCGVSGSLNKDFACDSNSGSSVLVPSVVVSNLSVTAVRSNIVFFFSGQVPNWWALQAGGCRAGAVSAAPAAGGRTGCIDYFGTHQGASVFNWTVFTRDGVPEGYRLDLLTYTLPQFASPVTGEIYCGIVTIDHRRTAGADSCSGCSLRGGFTLLNVLVDSIELPGGIVSDSPANRDYVFWQQSAVPTRSTTWGGVKALYR